ncbi:MAG: hypothetical protein HC821_01475 [Lewinella sp.]|nr:hypothetical protein [Lewinella sp.]
MNVLQNQAFADVKDAAVYLYRANTQMEQLIYVPGESENRVYVDQLLPALHRS